MSAISLVAAQEQFTATLSAVEDAVKFAFRGASGPRSTRRRWPRPGPPPGAPGTAWSSGARTRSRSASTGSPPTRSATSGNGRKVGNPTCGRGAMDVYHRKAQAAGGFTLVSLDSGDEVDAGDSTAGSWREWLAEDNRVGPADEAAFRVDFEGWLEGLPERKRRVAELLAEGHEGVVVARLVGIAPSRVSQLRAELEASWRAFQAGAVAT